MADNTTLPGTGDVIATDDIGGIKFQRVKPAWGPDGTATDTDKVGNELPVQDAPRLILVTASTVTRPANVTAYAANDAVSNSATAGSVTPISWTFSDVNNAPILLRSFSIDTTDTGVAGKSFRLWLYRSDPSASTGIVGGDNAAFSVKKAGFIGRAVGTFIAFSDGCAAVLQPESYQDLIALPTSGAKTVFGLLETLDAFTPSANSTTFIVSAYGFQGRP
jgi:hypothetical protein